MSRGSVNPETRALLIVAPVAASYTPIVPLTLFATKSFPPDKARPNGESNPETSEAFTTAPEVVYSPIVPLARSTTNNLFPETAMPTGTPSEISDALLVAPVAASYTPTGPPSFATKNLPPDRASPYGESSSETKALLIGVAERDLDEQRRLEREAQTRRFRELLGAS